MYKFHTKLFFVYVFSVSFSSFVELIHREPKEKILINQARIGRYIDFLRLIFTVHAKIFHMTN